MPKLWKQVFMCNSALICNHIKIKLISCRYKTAVTFYLPWNIKREDCEWVLSFSKYSELGTGVFKQKHHQSIIKFITRKSSEVIWYLFDIFWQKIQYLWHYSQIIFLSSRKVNCCDWINELNPSSVSWMNHSEWFCLLDKWKDLAHSFIKWTFLPCCHINLNAPRKAMVPLRINLFFIYFFFLEPGSPIHFNFHDKSIFKISPFVLHIRKSVIYATWEYINNDRSLIFGWPNIKC